MEIAVHVSISFSCIICCTEIHIIWIDSKYKPVKRSVPKNIYCAYNLVYSIHPVQTFYISALTQRSTGCIILGLHFKHELGVRYEGTKDAILNAYVTHEHPIYPQVC